MHTEHAFRRQHKVLLIATTDPEIRKSLTALFNQEIYEVNFVQRGADVVLRILEKDMDILILDLDMYGNVGIEIIPVIRKLRPRLPIVLVSDDFTNRITQPLR